MNPIEKLTAMFERFPGIGPRQARRFVHFLLTRDGQYRQELSSLILSVGKETTMCKSCYRWFVRGDSKGAQCGICSNPSRDHATLFVLEKDADIDNVERGGFKGLYFVLGGTIALASEQPERSVRERELLRRIETDGNTKTLKEVILGLSATSEGDHTRMILEESLRPLSATYSFKISTLGRGLSTGSELEYADPDTIAQALGNRR